MENKKITIDDIAKELGVSKTTVSRAISGKGRIGKETTEKILSFIEKKNYKPSAIAKSLAQSKTFNVAFALPEESKVVDLPFFQKCMWGITSAAAANDYDVMICVVGENDITRLKRLTENHKVDGVILGRTCENALAENYLEKEGMPYLTIGTSALKSAAQIDFDHVKACKELTERLLKSGLKKLAVIGGNTEHIVNRSRLEGFRAAHNEMKMVPDENMIITGSSDPGRVIPALEKILKMQPDCIVCTDDSVCYTVLNRLAVLHIRIPADIKVASFYNSTTLDNHKPSVTSLDFDAFEAGMLSFNVLFDMINGKAVNNRTLLDYRVIERESTEV